MRSLIKKILNEEVYVNLTESLKSLASDIKSIKHEISLAKDSGDFEKVQQLVHKYNEISDEYDKLYKEYDEPLIKRKPKNVKKEPITFNSARDLLIKDVMNTNKNFYNDLKKYSHNYGNYKNWWKDNRNDMIEITLKKYDNDFIDSIKRNKVDMSGYPKIIGPIIGSIIENFFDQIRTSRPYKDNFQTKYTYSSYDRMELPQQSGPADVSELWVELFGEPKDSDFIK